MNGQRRQLTLSNAGKALGYALFIATWAISAIALRQLWGLHFVMELLLIVSLFPLFHYARKAKLRIGALVTIAALTSISYCLTSPKLDRDWQPAFEKLPALSIEGEQVTITHFRNFQWHAKNKATSEWETRTFDLKQLQSLEFVVVPFGIKQLTAHTMLLFGFKDGQKLVVSIEARQEADEKYSLAAGAFRQFELIYLFGAPNDLLTTRAVYRENEIYAFPIKATPSFIKALFLDLAQTANALNEKPEFYALFTRNCTTTLLQHTQRIHQSSLGMGLKAIFPATAGEVLHELGYVDTSLSYLEAKKQFRIDEKIRQEAAVE